MGRCLPASRDDRIPALAGLVLMECFPACLTCTGLCKQEVPVPAVASPATRRAKPYNYPVEPYLKMGCGHFTDATEQSVFRTLDTKHMLKVPRRKKTDLYWCDRCQDWTGKWKTETIELPEEPLF